MPSCTSHQSKTPRLSAEICIGKKKSWREGVQTRKGSNRISTLTIVAWRNSHRRLKKNKPTIEILKCTKWKGKINQNFEKQPETNKFWEKWKKKFFFFSCVRYGSLGKRDIEKKNIIFWQPIILSYFAIVSKRSLCFISKFAYLESAVHSSNWNSNWHVRISNSKTIPVGDALSC